MAAFCLSVIVFVGACAWDSVECFIYIQLPGLEHNRVMASILSTLDDIEMLFLLALLPLFAVLVGLALSGSMWRVPLLKRLALRRWPLRISFVINSCALGLIPVLAGFAFWASSLTGRSGDDAKKVYFLYDEGIPVPRWGYAMGLSRIALQARRNWGMQSTALDRLTKETLREALKNARVLILATHGENGCAATYYAPSVLGVWPAESGARDETNSRHFLRLGIAGVDKKWTNLENVSVNNDLQLAYIFACHAGNKASQWAEHLAPAHVVTYNRFSTVWDHAIWFAFKGPAELRSVSGAVKNQGSLTSIR